MNCHEFQDGLQADLDATPVRRRRTGDHWHLLSPANG